VKRALAIIPTIPGDEDWLECRTLPDDDPSVMEWLIGVFFNGRSAMEPLIGMFFDGLSAMGRLIGGFFDGGDCFKSPLALCNCSIIGVVVRIVSVEEEGSVRLR